MSVLPSVQAKRWAWWVNLDAVKTTVGRSILRLVRPTSGSVIFDGKDVLGDGQE